MNDNSAILQDARELRREQPLNKKVQRVCDRLEMELMAVRKVGRPRKHASSKERQQRYRDRLRERRQRQEEMS